MPQGRAAWAVLISTAALSLAAARPPAAAEAPVAAVGLPPTPLLSVRRDPSWVEDRLVGQQFPVRMAAAVAGQVGAPAGSPGCVVVAQNGQVLYAVDADAELLPASNIKLLTATAVLDQLGPAFRYATAVEASEAPRGGAVEGNLYLVGGGDPFLMTAAYNASTFYPEPDYTSLDQLARAVRAAGVRRVAGSVVGVSSRYDSLIGVPTWSPEYLAEGDVGPLSALEVDDGASPPPPPPPPSTSTTTPTSSTTIPPSSPSEAPPRPRTFAPTASAAALFAARLRAAGVSVGGGSGTGFAPYAPVVVASVQSPPLAAEVEQMLRVSDDTAAELFTKELGRHATGVGSTSAGTAAILQGLAKDGLVVSRAVMRDGSGLDRGDRATCGLLVAVLERAGPSGVIAAGLPVAGRSGTLSERFKGTPAAGRLRGKTGTLVDVAALSGFVVPASAPTPELAAPVYYSIIVNGMPSRLSASVVDRIATAVASYPDAVPLSVVGPRS